METNREEELVDVAHTRDRTEAEMVKAVLAGAGIESTVQADGVDGVAINVGWLNPAGAPRWVLVRAADAEAARAVLAEAAAAGEREDWHELAEAPHAESGRRLRDYGLVGAYARIWFWSIVAMGLAFGIFLLLRAA